MLVVLNGLFHVADLLKDLLEATEAVGQVSILNEFQHPVGCPIELLRKSKMSLILTSSRSLTKS